MRPIWAPRYLGSRANLGQSLRSQSAVSCINIGPAEILFGDAVMEKFFNFGGAHGLKRSFKEIFEVPYMIEIGVLGFGTESGRTMYCFICSCRLDKKTTLL